MITLEIDNSTQFATAYRDGRPIATVQRARCDDRTGPQWSGYDLDGKIIFASMFNLSADAMIRRIERALPFTTTPAKIALEHQEEVRALVAQGIKAAMRAELVAYRHY